MIISLFLIGNLWTVTDKDTDLMTIEFIKKLSKTQDLTAQNLCKIVKELNQACKLKYLNGASLVILSL